MNTLLLAKAIAVEFSVRISKCMKQNCYGCYTDPFDRVGDHTDYCGKGLTGRCHALFSRLLSMVDHDHVTRLIFKYTEKMNVKLDIQSDVIFDREYRVNLAKSDSAFQDMILAFTLDDHPVQDYPARGCRP